MSWVIFRGKDDKLGQGVIKDSRAVTIMSYTEKGTTLKVEYEAKSIICYEDEVLSADDFEEALKILRQLTSGDHSRG